VAERLWLVDDGGVAPFDGDMEAYRRFLLSQRDGAPSRARAERAEKPKARRPAPAATGPLKAEVVKCEARVTKLEEMRGAIDSRLSNPILYARSDKTEISSLQKKRKEVLKGLERAEALWIAALERLEAAGARV
jgi:ATP-binding cassette subfamily F protein 3